MVQEGCKLPLFPFLTRKLRQRFNVFFLKVIHLSELDSHPQVLILCGREGGCHTRHPEEPSGQRHMWGSHSDCSERSLLGDPRGESESEPKTLQGAASAESLELETKVKMQLDCLVRKMTLRDQDLLMITQKGRIDTREQTLGLKFSHGRKSQRNVSG